MDFIGVTRMAKFGASMRAPAALLMLVVVFTAGCSSGAGTKAGLISAANGRTSIDLARYRAPRALSRFIDRLVADGRDWHQHGIYIESLRDAEPIAILNEHNEFNPASVMKLATSLAALHKLGSGYRFRTEFRADGEIHKGDLLGDLVLLSGGDPSFSISDARRVGTALRRIGIRRVTGRLIIVGAFTCNENSDTLVSAGVLSRNSGIVFKNPPQLVDPQTYQPRGYQVAAVESDSLLRIVQYLNAFSVNSMAEMLALHVGGPAGVERFLIEEIGMPRQSVFISHASGLDINRLTPRDTVKLLRAMMGWLDRHQLPPTSVMPVAGRDAGTLRTRFAETEFAGSVVAKTGTLYSTDAGVAALAGILYTRDYGPLLFAVYDMAEGRRVDHLRRIQDQFLKDLMTEFGGADNLYGDPAPRAGLRIESRVRLASGEVVVQAGKDDRRFPG